MPPARSRSPSDEELIKLGEELIAWCTSDTMRCQMAAFYSLEKRILREDWKAYIKQPVFRPYYEMAQSALAQNCTAGKLKEGFGQRYLRLYDRELTEEEDNVKRFDAELKSKEMQLVSDEDKARLDSLMSQLSSLQKLSSSSKTACKSECVTKDEDSEAGRSS